MESSRFNMMLVQGLLILFLSGIVKSHGTDYIKNLNNDQLYNQIQEDKIALGDSFSQGQQYYRLVLMVQEAVSRGLISIVPGTHKSDPSGTATALYKMADHNVQVKLPSTSDVSKATSYFQTHAMSITEQGSPSNAQGSSEPQLDRSGSVNTKSESFIQEERQRMQAEIKADRERRGGRGSEDEIHLERSASEKQGGEETPSIDRQDSVDSLAARADEFIRKNREEIAKRTPSETPLPTPPGTPAQTYNWNDYESDPEDQKKAGCFGKCLSFKGGRG